MAEAELACVVLEKARKVQRPSVDVELATRLAKDLFGIAAPTTISELHSYDDKNFYIAVLGAAAGEETRAESQLAEYVLKVHNAADSQEDTRPFLDAQNKVLTYLSGHGVFCPRVVTSVHGREVEFMELRREDGRSLTHGIRLLHYVPGTLMCHVKSQSTALLADLGRYMANIDLLLEGFSHPATVRDHLWDVNNLLNLRGFASLIQDPAKRAIVDDVFGRYERDVAPHVGSLVHIVCQSDANDHNIIISEDGEHVTAIIDFGDMVYTARVNELAITVAYALLEKENPMECAQALLQGYTRIAPLSPIEQQMIHTLVASRICQSVVMSNYSFSQNPENEYLLVTARPGWQLLTLLVGMSREDIDAFNAFAITTESPQ